MLKLVKINGISGIAEAIARAPDISEIVSFQQHMDDPLLQTLAFGTAKSEFSNLPQKRSLPRATVCEATIGVAVAMPFGI